MINQLSVSVQKRISSSVLVLLLLFFLSGFAALLYQVVWQRLLVFYTGSDTVSISLIVSAFMTGLGLGYLVGGRLADRASARANLRYFVGAELGIMVFAVCSKAILYDFLYTSAPVPADSPVGLYMVVFGVLLVPTFLMGVSLPVLSRAYHFGSMDQQARYISLLYFINTLGAALGALLTGFILVRQMGYHHALWVGAALNGICAMSAVWLGRRLAKEPSDQTVDSEASPEPLRFTSILIIWSLQYAVSGFAALSLELLWFRVLATLIKSVSLTFAVLLAIYLGSMAIGTVAGTWLTRTKAGQSAVWRERMFLVAQTVLYGYTALAISLFINSINRVPALHFLWEFFGAYETRLNPKFTIFTYGLIPLFLLFVPTFLMGLSFSLSQALIQDKYTEVGRKVGWLQFINIVGSALGAWGITWIGFPQYGTATLFQLIAGLSIVYAGILFIRGHWPALGTTIAVMLLLICILTIPKNARLWQIMNGVDIADSFLYDENESAVSVIKMAPDRSGGTVFVNGLGQSGMPYGHDEVHTVLGALPVMMHPNPERVAVIGLGSAGTVNGIGGRAETRQIDCFEIASNQALVLAEYAAEAKDTAVNAVLNDTRLRLIFRDGRYAIRNQGIYYDVIEADALRPVSPYSGNLYSKEYFELLRSRLKPGGLAVTWCPTVRVLNTFRQVFPYVAYYDQLILIGSNQPIRIDWSLIQQRAATDFSQTHYGRSGINIREMLDHYRTGLRLLPANKGTGKEINTDLFPKDEYSVLPADMPTFDEKYK